MLSSKEKEEIIEKYQLHEKDTGSPEIQLALLSERIDQLLGHLKDHPKDTHSKNGLLKLVSQRRSLLNYLKDKSEKRYNLIVDKLNLKKK